MSSNRLVGLVRIGLVAASLAFASGSAISATSVSAEHEIKARFVFTRPVGAPTPPLLATRCDGLKRLAIGASAAGDPKQAHDFTVEAAALGCI